ncbi:hypothetical protein Tco_1027096 [Tanacetum coccineum]
MHFPLNFLDFILAPPDYVPASLGKTYSSSSNNSFGVVPIVSPTLLLFHDDPYMKVMHAYYAKESPIPPPTIMPPSSMFNPQEFFLPMRNYCHLRNKAINNHSPLLLSYLKNLRWEKALIRQVIHDIIQLQSRYTLIPPKRMSTSEAPAMTQAAIRKLVANSVTVALEAQAANMANTDKTTRPREAHVARQATKSS